MRKRDRLKVKPPPDDGSNALSRWRQVLKNLTLRSGAQPFKDVVFGPVVQLDPQDPTPLPQQLVMKMDEEMARRSGRQPAS